MDTEGKHDEGGATVRVAKTVCLTVLPLTGNAARRVAIRRPVQPESAEGWTTHRSVGNRRER